MSGHSKWSTIKRAKGANDAKRGHTFTKIANAITIAARLGNSGDPDANPRLRMALDLARSANLPKDNITRAIDRGLGKLQGQVLEEVAYEGFGPGKVAYYIEAFTDNRQRTTSEIRNFFDRAGGSMGSPGVTAYMFDKKGEIQVKSKGGNSEDEQLELIDTGAEDVLEFDSDEGKAYLVSTNPTDLFQVSNKITQLGYQTVSADTAMIPNVTTEVTDPEIVAKVLAFTQKLEEHDDVQKVYANFDIPEELAA